MAIAEECHRLMREGVPYLVQVAAACEEMAGFCPLRGALR
jgi:hypothetical protein